LTLHKAKLYAGKAWRQYLLLGKDKSEEIHSFFCLILGLVCERVEKRTLRALVLLKKLFDFSKADTSQTNKKGKAYALRILS